MPLSFDFFQLILAIVMVVGLFLHVLPFLRIVKWARLPLSSVLLMLVPLLNIAWFSYVVTLLRCVPSSHEEN